ncbi:MAG: hypothetical protein KAI57_03340 [Candidatus Pacebacteria bacterium]|nr:hypothetical protein [Candidatus Paceibacterota bacterium]
MVLKNIDRIIRITFCFFIVILLSFFIIPKENAFAGYYEIVVGSGAGAAVGAIPVITIDTTNVIKIETLNNLFDDNGYVTLTSPTGLVTTPASMRTIFACGDRSFANGDVTSDFPELGIYTVTTSAWCGCGAGCHSDVKFGITTLGPPTCIITATPNSIDRGNSSVLTWSQTDANTITFDDGTGSIPITVGFVIPPVSPSMPTTYTIAVSNTIGNDTCSTIVDFNPTCSLTATPLIFSGMDSNLNWTTEDAVSVALNGNSESLNGSTIDPGSANSPYTLIATNSVGATATCNASTLVSPCEKGLVPCGRLCDAPETIWDDTESCEVCHGILLMNQGMNFLIQLAGIVAVLALVVVGFLYITSVGNPERKNLAKTSFKWVIIGFIIIFLSWLIIDFILVAWGFLDPLGGKWNVICD